MPEPLYIFGFFCLFEKLMTCDRSGRLVEICNFSRTTLRSALPDAKQASFIIRFTEATDLKPDQYILRLRGTKPCRVLYVLSYPILIYALIYALLPVTNTLTISSQSVSHDYLLGCLGVDRFGRLPGVERIYYYRYGGASWIGKEIAEAPWPS